MKKKLELKKVFISNLQDYEMKNIVGGSALPTCCDSCVTYCSCGCNTVTCYTKDLMVCDSEHITVCKPYPE